ncbi:hypothetical protein LCGC14_0598760 [marine sediment metagenome]|uniref:Uncharacterized protein n=1 Tax=marine sediment metagenome TaxID=412755 RepID=A0A0F9UJN5_9ZZZZ
MFRKGTRVVIVDEVEAQRVSAIVYNGQKGTIGEPCTEGNVNVHMDGDLYPTPWAVPTSCVRRLHRAKGGR